MRLGLKIAFILLSLLAFTSTAFAREIEYRDQEENVYVLPGEPTQIKFPGSISSGFRKKLSGLDIQRKDGDLIIFAKEGITTKGEGIVIRLKDGRSYSLRIKLSDEQNPRDSIIKMEDNRLSQSEETPRWKGGQFEYAASTTVSGLMRDMILVSEFGKKGITGYRVSESHNGEVIFNDGTMISEIERIFIGPTLWGYVLNTKNLLDQTQRINPASFRIDGTRAILAENWELSAKPLNIEQQISKKDKSKVYIITKAKR